MKNLLSVIIFTLTFLSINAYAIEANHICPMHPHIHGVAGDTCPICGMDLVPIASNDTSKQDGLPANIVTLSSGMIQTIGVKTAAVKQEQMGGTIRAFATLAPNMRHERTITSRADGWIDALGISALGDTVKKGDLLYKIHSPDIVIAQSDYILDLKTGRERTALKAFKVFHHYEIDEQVIAEIERTQSPLESVPYFAQSNGTVTQLNIRKGSYVTLNSVIATLQDFSTLWVNVAVSEKDLALINKNTKAKIILPHNNNRTITASIDAILPTINPETRTGTVRLLIDNTDGSLRPESYVDVIFTHDVAKRLVVPSEAILRNSTGAHVILALGEGEFSPQNVKTGYVSQGKTEITEGLSSGDVIVTSSQFLIDSESSLRESLNTFSAGGEHAGH